MNIYKRILHIGIAVGLIAVAMILATVEEEGPSVIALILGITTLVYGIRCFAAYITKFRYMVGGREQLYIGIIAMDLGLLIVSAFNGSSGLILLYLLGMRAFSGGIDIARALESKKHAAPWKTKLAAGILSLGTVLLGIIFFRNPDTVVDIYCIGLIISAVEHIITAFRRTEIVTIA